MRTYFIILILLFQWLTCSCVSLSQTAIKLSEDIYNKQVSIWGEDIFLKGMNNVYLQPSYWYNELDFSIQNDTIYLLEYPGIEGTYFFSFWNKKDTISYMEYDDTYKFFHDKIVFTKYMMKLVSEWNIQGIREEEKVHSDILPSNIVYATRIVIKSRKYTIDCIRFKNFFDFKRDGMDFSE